MKDSMTTLLFPTRLDPHTSSVIEPKMRSEGLTLDPNDSVEEAMQQSLEHVATLCSVASTTTNVLNYVCLQGELLDQNVHQNRKLVRLHTTSTSLEKNCVLSLCWQNRVLVLTKSLL